MKWVHEKDENDLDIEERWTVDDKIMATVSIVGMMTMFAIVIGFMR